MADTDTFRRRLSEKDFTLIASYGVDELRRREGEQRRKDLERQWKEVDRQVAMTPLDRVVIRDSRLQSLRGFLSSNFRGRRRRLNFSAPTRGG